MKLFSHNSLDNNISKHNPRDILYILLVLYWNTITKPVSYWYSINNSVLSYFQFEVTEFPLDLGCHNVRPVQQCPRNKFEMDIRAKSLNCTGLPKTATYHCVLNENGTGLLELCANKTSIHGKQFKISLFTFKFYSHIS